VPGGHGVSVLQRITEGCEVADVEPPSTFCFLEFIAKKTPTATNRIIKNIIIHFINTIHLVSHVEALSSNNRFLLLPPGGANVLAKRVRWGDFEPL